MNKMIIIGMVVAACFLASCTKNFEELNTDPNRIEKISPGTLLNPIIYGLASFNAARSNAVTFDLMQVTLGYPSATGGLHRYDIPESVGNSTWNTYYQWLTNIKEMKVAADAAEDANYQAIALTLNAWAYAILTDVFGDVPKDEACRADEGILHPTFNTQQEIYTSVLTDLATANELFDPETAMVYGTEILYNNNVANWQKFCNSLRLRLLLRVSSRPEMNALATMATILADPDRYPVFTSNNESAILRITGVTPNLSPWGRVVDFNLGRRSAAFFLDNLNSFSDPRLPRLAFEATSSDGSTKLGYKGIPSGFAGDVSQFNFEPSNMNTALAEAPMNAILMSYSELEFIQAELIQKGVVTGNAEAHYKKGVQAAIEQWGASMPSNYFDNVAAAYDGTLERIMLQKYYALFFTDYQQWFEYRRTGFPVLPKGDGMLNNQQMPARFRYPVVVAQNNRANYQQALERMGPDDINTKVWWQQQ